MSKLGLILVLLTFFFVAEAKEKSSMYMKNSGSEDMKTSESGYDYKLHSGVPVSFQSFKTDKSGTFSNDYPPLGYRYGYANSKLPLPEIPLSSKFAPGQYDTLYTSYGIPISYAAYVEPVKGYEDFVGTLKPGSYPNMDRERKTLLKAAAQNLETWKSPAAAKKGPAAIIPLQEFDKGLKGSKDFDDHNGFYKALGAVKGGYYDTAGNFDKKKEGGGGSRSESFGDKKDNKKGIKTSGYHRVYLKDDYNKDHSFYDKADKNGFFRRYGDHNAKNGAKEGAFKTGGHHDSGFHGGAFDTKGLSEKGKFLDESKGYKAAGGGQRYFQNDDKYAGKSGKEFGKELGFTEADKLGNYGR